MEIIEITSQEYKENVNAKIVYNKQEFIALNSYKTKSVNYLLLQTSKKYFATVVGEYEDGKACIPFSAPFSLWEDLRKKWSIDSLYDAICCFDDYASEHYKQVTFIFLGIISSRTNI